MKHMNGWHAHILTIVLSFASIETASAADKIEVRQVAYKKIDGHELNMTVYAPKQADTASLPAIIFYFGGGWNVGNPKVFEKQARYLASRGMVAFCPEYRVVSRHGTRVAECVKDAKSAFRYVMGHADEFGIDPTRVVAAGVSAGGHLAASLACIDGFNEQTDDTSISPNPYALVLFCPALRIEHEQLNDAYRQRFAGLERALSPYHHIKPGMPPTLILAGTADKQVPIEDLQAFAKRMNALGNDCVVRQYERQGHAFFHYDRNPECFQKTLHETEVFLGKLLKFNTEPYLEDYMDMLSNGKN